MSRAVLRRTVTRLVVILAVAWGQTTVANDRQAVQPAKPADASSSVLAVSLPSSEGTSIGLESLRGSMATVLLFLSTDCPISNGYVPTMNRLAESYAPRGVSFVGLNPNNGQSVRSMRQHKAEYRIGFAYLQDSGGRIAERLGVSTCPTAIVLDARDQVVYQGRIDDRYARRGGAANVVRRADLTLALNHLLAGRPIQVPRTTPLGCPVVKPKPSPAAKQIPAESITYTQHVSRLLQKHCERCHHQGGIGPFALSTYRQALTWARDIQTFTANRSMPPWAAVAGWGDFINPRVLSQAEIDLLAQWVEAGCLEGDPQFLPRPASFSDGWEGGTPDVILEPTADFHLAADGPDVYRGFVLPTNFGRDVFVKTMEVRPGNKRVVHHVLVFLDTTEQSTQRDRQDPGPGYAMTLGNPGFLILGGLGGWGPGNNVRTMPDGMAKIIPKGAKVVMQMHYHKTGKPETDRTRLGLYFSRQPVTRVAFFHGVMPLSHEFRVPAGAANHEVRVTHALPIAARAISVTPHMHVTGKDMKLTATLPDGTVQKLMYVKPYDFNWQETYNYRNLIKLPAGTRLDMVAHHDNSTANPFNPNRPPKEIRWGDQTSDEMCIAFLTLVPEQEARSEADLRLPTRAELLRYLYRARSPSQTLLPSYFDPLQPSSQPK